MQIPDSIRKCVAFVGFQMANGDYKLKGTCFFLRRAIEGFPMKAGFYYAVTARHVITKIRDLGIPSVLIRANLPNTGATWISTKTSEWLFHPSDPTVDVAVLPIRPVGTDHKAFMLESSVTDEMIATGKVGIGDEVFLTGLFAPHHGKQNNIPIVRIGNIAAMPAEKVSTRLGPIDAYLIEARSIGGLSGSPVFVNIGGFVRGVAHFSIEAPQLFLLGLMHGHFDSDSLEPDAITEDSLQEETINMGIGIVVPIAKVLEVIRQPKITQPEEDEIKQIRQRGLPKMDSADTIDDAEKAFTQSDFETALRKVSRKIEPKK